MPLSVPYSLSIHTRTASLTGTAARMTRPHIMDFRSCSWIAWLKIRGFSMNFTPSLSGLENNIAAGNPYAISAHWKNGDKGLDKRTDLVKIVKDPTG